MRTFLFECVIQARRSSLKYHFRADKKGFQDHMPQVLSKSSQSEDEKKKSSSTVDTNKLIFYKEKGTLNPNLSLHNTM